MRKFLFGVLLTITIVLIYRQCTIESSAVVISETDLIEEQIKNVGKLIVSEGKYSEVFTYEDSKEIFGSYLTADKRALVVARTDVTIAYDLSKLTYRIDSINKILRITHIPEEEISIYPEFEYYDVQSDFFNSFEADDYNSIRDEVKDKIGKRINESKLKINSQNRLISELSKFYILTQSMGWTLEYNTNRINKEEDFEKLLL